MRSIFGQRGLLQGRKARGMSFSQSVRTCCKKAFVWQGRASRSEFWYFFALSYMAEGLLLSLMRISLEIGHIRGALIAGQLAVFVFCPVLSVTVRRLHDRNRPGWVALLLWSTILAGCAIGYAAYKSAFFARLATGKIPSAEAAVLTVCAVLTLAAAVFLLHELCSAGTQGPNRFGRKAACPVQPRPVNRLHFGRYNPFEEGKSPFEQQEQSGSRS